MTKRIGPKVKQVLNVAMLHVRYIFGEVCHKHNSLPLGPIQPSSPYTKELHALATTPFRNPFQVLRPWHGEDSVVLLVRHHPRLPQHPLRGRGALPPTQMAQRVLM